MYHTTTSRPAPILAGTVGLEGFGYILLGVVASLGVAGGLAGYYLSGRRAAPAVLAGIGLPAGYLAWMGLSRRSKTTKYAACLEAYCKQHPEQCAGPMALNPHVADPCLALLR